MRIGLDATLEEQGNVASLGLFQWTDTDGSLDVLSMRNWVKKRVTI